MTLPPDLVGALLDALADRLASRILTTRERSVYTSLDLPPHTTRRRFREVCPHIPEATKHGSVGSVPCAAWDAYRLRRRGAARGGQSIAPTPLAARADALLARSGLRVVRESR